MLTALDRRRWTLLLRAGIISHPLMICASRIMEMTHKMALPKTESPQNGSPQIGILPNSSPTAAPLCRYCCHRMRLLVLVSRLISRRSITYVPYDLPHLPVHHPLSQLTDLNVLASLSPYFLPQLINFPTFPIYPHHRFSAISTTPSSASPPNLIMPSSALTTRAARQIELRFSATDLANKDFLSLSDPFLVCHTVRNGAPAERIGHTETVKDDLNPVWATTMSCTYIPEEHASSILLIDVFDRDSEDDKSLRKHDFLGRAVLRISDLLSAPHTRLDIPLAPARHLILPSSTTMSLVTDSNDEEWLPRDFSTLSIDEDKPEKKDLKRATTSNRASKKVRGSLSVYAEALNHTEGMNVIFRVSSAMLKDVGTLKRRVTQFYEIQRERREGDSVTWSCVYRSKDGINIDRNNYVVFDEMSVTELQLHNLNPDRRLRIAFYKRFTRQQHELISYVTTSMSEILEKGMRPDAPMPMEGTYGDDDGMGNVILRRVERWVQKPVSGDLNNYETGNVYVTLRADHFLHKKFISSLNDSPRHVRKLRQLPSFISMH